MSEENEKVEENYTLQLYNKLNELVELVNEYEPHYIINKNEITETANWFVRFREKYDDARISNTIVPFIQAMRPVYMIKHMYIFLNEVFNSRPELTKLLEGVDRNGRYDHREALIPRMESTWKYLLEESDDVMYRHSLYLLAPQWFVKLKNAYSEKDVARILYQLYNNTPRDEVKIHMRHVLTEIFARNHLLSGIKRLFETGIETNSTEHMQAAFDLLRSLHARTAALERRLMH